ncbi:MAG TPA: gliding motility-associated C-terminal domain-containing protein [Mucilaginibacter sp.]|nr:gliding motility-associated C-terminal domain-containing protein [Mucilaginibacter sp.]
MCAQQQDVDFTLTNTLLQGKNILKIRRDFYDPYLWVLANNNQVYRVNSNTLTVDDYTPQFAQYHNLQFIDIAGLNQDTVFVATNSTNVVEYKKGILITIGATDGLTDTVNSVGIGNASGDIGTGYLYIGTLKGRASYNPVTEQLQYFIFVNGVGGKIFEATYRRFTGETNYNAQPLIPIADYGQGGGMTYTIWLNPVSGPNILTALTTEPYMISPGFGSFYETGVFWGNENGFFGESSDFDGYPRPYDHYLQNIKVNKITDVFGFASLGNPLYNSYPLTIAKQNLLVGTDNGLYFSSSVYGNFTTNNLHLYSMFHSDVIGNTAVNDICVNSTSSHYDDIYKGCEGNIWLACNNGLYLIKPDYAKYLDPVTQLQVLQCGNLPFPDTSKIVNLCQGDTAHFYLPYFITTTDAVQWVKDGVNIPGETGPTLDVTAPGDYYVVIYASCENVHVQTNHFTVITKAGPVFSFNYPDKLQYCDSTSTTLKTNYNPAYHYRWYTNGALNGDTTFNYTVTQSGKYKVEVSACINSWVPSKETEVDLVNLPGPVISSAKNIYCAGDSALVALNIPADASYTINWYKDGSLIAGSQDKTNILTANNGNYSVMVSSNTTSCTKTSNTVTLTFTPGPVFTSQFPATAQFCAGSPVNLQVDGNPGYSYRWYTNGALNGDTTAIMTVTQTGKYKVEASTCPGAWVSSNEIEVTMLSIPTPVIKTDKLSYCVGDNATLTTGVQPDPLYTINWYRDGTLLGQSKDQTSLVTDLPGNYTVVVTANQVNTDSSVCSETSAVQAIQFAPLPTVSIQQIVTTTLCDGQTVDLKVNYDSGTITWNTGQTGGLITVDQSGTYTATVTNAAGCTRKADINVRFLPNPVLNVPNAKVCVPSHKTATITAPAGLASYTWNGIPGSNTFSVDHAQTVTLVVTNSSGCQATQEIQVTDDCPDINIPNAFTPNGDGVNDTWNIAGLSLDATALVQIFDRYGQQVYESKGYSKPWDGRSKGKQLPSGTYYYLIKAKNNTLTYSGYVAVLY